MKQSDRKLILHNDKIFLFDTKFGILCQNYDENVKNFANFRKSGKQ